MRDIPIIFSAPMILALLDGRKTMTRRLAWAPFDAGAMTIEPGEVVIVSFERELPKGGRTRHAGPGPFDFVCERPSSWQTVKPGDRLYVRESHYRYGRWVKAGRTPTDRQRWRFKATVWNRVPHNNGPVLFSGEIEQRDIAKQRTDTGWHLRPSIFLPREFSRLTLAVTATKVEKLQAISRADAIAEGATMRPTCSGLRNMHDGWSMDWPEDGPDSDHALGDPQAAFGAFINKLHGGPRWNLKPTNLWDQNPEVVALTFTVHQTNIDRMKAAA